MIPFTIVVTVVLMAFHTVVITVLMPFTVFVTTVLMVPQTVEITVEMPDMTVVTTVLMAFQTVVMMVLMVLMIVEMTVFIKTWICRDKRKGIGCKGRNVKEEELLKCGDAARIVVKSVGLEVM